MSVAKKLQKNFYSKFDQIDGSHPFKKKIPKGFIDYPARIRKGGRVAYFNFALAKEMGIIEADHEEEINKELSDKILSTFSIQIINEFDQMNGKSFPKNEVKSGTYMATRYLQLQHDDKKGRTSGDGRSIWNGQIKNKGKSWDISSCGTGATRLSPATSKYNKFFETGDPAISYGCGYAEFDEGLATAILSNIFANNNLSTEETLVVIEYKNNLSINVRAHSNLLRPSHFFLYLKQNDYSSLKGIVDYYIEREMKKSDWKDCPRDEKKYDFFLRKVCDNFAKIAAKFEDDYIFCWLDWDGDNVLMDGGVIDYGSIRQFGLCHYEYRYDDVERFSTNLLEQKGKAKYIVQTFVQLIDYLKKEEKKGISHYNDDKTLGHFDERFEYYKNKNLLEKIGFGPRQQNQLLKRSEKEITYFRQLFSYFERTKSKKGMIKVSDGKTWDAIFCMRSILRELPTSYLIEESLLSEDEFLEIIKSEFATKEDLELSSYRKRKITEFQKAYQTLVRLCAKLFQQSEKDVLRSLAMRSGVINKADRVTGDAITHIVDRVMKSKSKLSSVKLYQLISDLKRTQNLDPEREEKLSQAPRGILKELIDIVKENRAGL